MEYTIQKLAHLAGTTTRTLRYYDEIGLLMPARINSSGYRIYGEEQVDALQQILFFKELGFELNTIAEIMKEPSFSRLQAMEEHLKKLQQRERQIQLLIGNVERSIRREKGEIKMSDKEKFEGFKKELIEENEIKYGKEIREKYGEETVAESNRKMMNLTQEEYDRMNALGGELHQKLIRAVNEKADYKGEAGREIALLHKQWLSFTWNQYSVEAHKGLAEMYVADERFTAYYDQEVSGCAEFLRDAICYHIK